MLRLKVVETRHDMVVADLLGSAIRHTIPMSRIRLRDETTLHPHGLGRILWWDEDRDAYYDTEHPVVETEDVDQDSRDERDD